MRTSGAGRTVSGRDGDVSHPRPRTTLADPLPWGKIRQPGIVVVVGGEELLHGAVHLLRDAVEGEEELLPELRILHVALGVVNEEPKTRPCVLEIVVKARIPERTSSSRRSAASREAVAPTRRLVH